MARAERCGDLDGRAVCRQRGADGGVSEGGEVSVGGLAGYGGCGEFGRDAVGGDDGGGKDWGTGFCGGVCTAWGDALYGDEGGEGWVDRGEGVKV